jgi:transposase-like protein
MAYPLLMVRAVVEELCGTELSKSTVSSLCKGLDDIVPASERYPPR